MKRRSYELSRRFDRPVFVGLLASVGASALVIIFLSTLSWNPSRLVFAGDGFTDPAKSPKTLFVHRGTIGFDGQFFYRLALDPATSQRTESGITLDVPSYRQQRLLYPTLAWGVSLGGRPPLIPWALVGLNVIGLGFIAWLGARIVRKQGIHPLWGLVFAGFPGFLFTLRLDLSEIMATALMLAAFVALDERRSNVAAILMTLAVLTKETTLVAAAALGMLALMTKLRRRVGPPLRVATFPAIAYLTIQVVLWKNWGRAPVTEGSGNIGLPFVGMVQEFSRWAIPHSTSEAFRPIGLVLLALFLGASIVALRRGKASSPAKLAFALYLLLIISLTSVVWFDYSNFLRAMSEAFVLGAVLIAHGSRASRRFLYVALGEAIWSVGLAVFLL